MEKEFTPPREVLTYGPGSHEFYPADYPWLRTLRVCMQASQAGASSDGHPGQTGQFTTQDLPVEALPLIVEIVVGVGGRGAPGAPSGDPGLLILELYDTGA